MHVKLAATMLSALVASKQAACPDWTLLVAGHLLASGGVAGEMFLWKPSTETQQVFGAEESESGWRSSAVLRSAVNQPADSSPK